MFGPRGATLSVEAKAEVGRQGPQPQARITHRRAPSDKLIDQATPEAAWSNQRSQDELAREALKRGAPVQVGRSVPLTRRRTRRLAPPRPAGPARCARA